VLEVAIRDRSRLLHPCSRSAGRMLTAGSVPVPRVALAVADCADKIADVLDCGRESLVELALGI
jgi:hypothetical protein